MYLIWSIEHTAWWRPARAGYTRVLAEAGRYERAEAAKIVEDANVFGTQFNECLVPLECVIDERDETMRLWMEHGQAMPPKERNLYLALFAEQQRRRSD